jgi:AcrR family transcriptional regulator
MLQQAHVALILRKGYERTTIKDICDEANVGRSTFYAHYKGKDDLRRSSLDHLRRLLVDRQKSSLATAGSTRERSLGFSLALFEHARDHIHLYRALVGGRGGAIALGTVRQILADLVRNELTAAIDQDSTDAAPREFLVQYVVGAYMAVLTWWLDRGAKLSPQRMDAWFRRLAIDGITASYSLSPTAQP